MSMRKLAARILYPVNSNPIIDGFVCIDNNGVVIETGKLENREEADEYYEGILMPGFVNSHCHIELSHLKGVFEQATGMAGFIRQINKLRHSAGESERREMIAKQMENLYESGVSAMADISNCNESFSAKASSKIYTRTFLEVFGTEAADCQSIIQGVVKLKDEAAEAGIDAAPTPHSCYTMSPELLESSIREGFKSGFISYHNQESMEEEELLISGTGELAKEYKGRGLSLPKVTGESSLLYFIDIFRKVCPNGTDTNILLVHNTFTNRRSIESALKFFKNPFWVLCPMSNLFIHRALPPVSLLISSGAQLALGTDSLSSNTTLSMVEEIKTIHKYFPEIELGEILKWATINGARALGKDDELGSFEAGKKPGVIYIDNIDFVNLKLTNQSNSHRLV